MPAIKKPRDLRLLDALDAQTRETFALPVWRVVRVGRDPLAGVPSRSRWCDGTFEVIYASLSRDTALAEIYALLGMQPVFPTKVDFVAHKIRINCTKAARLDTFDRLAIFGIDKNSYADRNYTQTQAVADAAYFLGFDSLIVPSARHEGQNVVYFSNHISPSETQIIGTDALPIDWLEWRKSRSQGKL
jgi:RES domain-containing protein